MSITETIPTHTATMTAQAGIVTVTLSNGATFTTKDGGQFVQRLDRQMRAANILRAGWSHEAGVLVTTVRDFN